MSVGGPLKLYTIGFWASRGRGGKRLSSMGAGENSSFVNSVPQDCPIPASCFWCEFVGV